MDDGAKLAVEDINAAGGIEALDGAELVLSSGDSKGEAETGQSEAQRLIDEGAVALVGTYQSDVTLNVASVAERSRVPLVIDVAVDDQILEQGYQYTFRIQPNATAHGPGRRRAPRSRSPSRAARPSTRWPTSTSEGAFGTSVFEAFKEQAESQGIDRRQGGHLLAHQLLRRHHAGPRGRGGRSRRHRRHRLLPRPAAGRQGGEGAQARHPGALRRRQRRLRRRELPRATRAPPARACSRANYHYDAASDRTQDIRKRFEQEYGTPMQTASVLSYQAVEVIAQALEEARLADPADLREAISGISLDDPLLAFDGPIEFDETGQNDQRDRRRDAGPGRKVEQVAPEEFADHQGRSTRRRVRRRADADEPQADQVVEQTAAEVDASRRRSSRGVLVGVVAGRSCSACWPSTRGRPGPRPGHPGDRDRHPARRRLRPGLGRA